MTLQPASELAQSAIAGEREYAALCTEEGSGECAGFDREVLRHAREVQARAPLGGAGVLLLRPKSPNQGLHLKEFAQLKVGLWLGLLLNRAVFIQRDARSMARGALAAPECTNARLALEEYFVTRGGHSLSWERRRPPELWRSGRDGEAPLVLNKSSWHCATHSPFASARLVELEGDVRVQVARAVLRARADEPSGHLATVLRSEQCFNLCAGFAVTRPSPRLSALIEPAASSMRRAVHRVGLAVSTLAAQGAVCFPDDTPLEQEAVDKAFGNNACMRVVAHHFAFKLVPAAGAERRNSNCSRSHVAEVTPLSAWLPCASTLLRGARQPRRTHGETLQTAVFVASDASAVEAYARVWGAQQRPRELRLLTLGDGAAADGADGAALLSSAESSCSDGAAGSARWRVHAQAAGRWFLLQSADLVLAPLERSLERSLCAARPSQEDCVVLGPIARPSSSAARRGGRAKVPSGAVLSGRPAAGALALGRSGLARQCALAQCFPSTLSCSGCRWQAEHMGKRLFRASRLGAERFWASRYSRGCSFPNCPPDAQAECGLPRPFASAAARPASIRLALQGRCQAGLLLAGPASENVPLLLRVRAGTQLADGTSAAASRTLVICRAPKAGSLTLRSIALASVHGDYARMRNENPAALPTLAQASAGELRDFWDGSERVERLAWVRHPVARSLHGWRQLDPLGSPEQFGHFVRGRFADSCGERAQRQSLDPLLQHVLPPQHCRCGMACGVRWRVHRIEDEPIDGPLRSLLPERWLPPAGSRGLNSAMGRHLNESFFLTPEVLCLLNRLTAHEQRLLGYAPYVVDASCGCPGGVG